MKIVGELGRSCLETGWRSRRLAVLGLAGWLALAGAGWAAEAPEDWLKRQIPLYRLQGAGQIDHFLRELHEHYPDFQAALATVARLRLGTPYLLGCLGEEKLPDAEPVFRIDRADCTVFVLTTSALARSRSTAEARNWMKRLNYYPAAPGLDPVSYNNRVHFTEDRLLTSAYFSDITATVAPAERLQTVDLVLNRKAGGQPLLPIPWQKPLRLGYLPVSAVDDAVLRRLPSVAGVAFVRTRNFANGLAVSHEGMLLEGRTLIEASSIKKVVQASDFLTYLRGNGKPYFDGVLFYTFR